MSEMQSENMLPLYRSKSTQTKKPMQLNDKHKKQKWK